MIFQPGQIIYDAGGHPPVADMKATDAVALVQYRSEVTPLTAWKQIPPETWHAYNDAGIVCLLVYEFSEGSSLNPGNGLAAAALLCDWIDQALGGAYPVDWPLLYAGGDFGATADQMPAIAQNFQAFHDYVLVRRGNPAGFYGGGFDIRWINDNTSLGQLSSVIWWQATGAANWGALQPETHLSQKGQTKVGGVTVDINTVLRPFDPSAPQGEPVSYLCSDPGGNVYEVSPGGVKPVTGWELATVHTGQTVHPADQATLDRLAFYIAKGRWQDANGNDPGPREAKGTSVVTGPSASDIAKAVNDDAARRLSA